VIKKILSVAFIFIIYSLLFPSENKKVSVYTQQVSARVYKFYADNSALVPYQVIVYVGKNRKEREKFYNIIPEKSISNLLFIYTNSYKEEPFYITKTIIGDPNRVKIHEEYPYLLPFKNGESFKVNQGYETRFTHRGWLKYSIDFGMKTGTPIYAARGGVVVAVKDTSRSGGRSRRYRGCANYITIAHDDGSFAQYVHLMFGGSVVKEGDVVKAGDLIGYSGATGRVTGPHLHFMVYIPVEEGLQTIPVKFLTKDGELVSIKSKNYYTAYNPYTEESNITTRGENSFEEFDDESLGEP
jgi:murein DD-endopeptidase MepM/ murein hydrolase activator NlpD